MRSVFLQAINLQRKIKPSDVFFYRKEKGSCHCLGFNNEFKEMNFKSGKICGLSITRVL